eukprot:228709-Hanusia_phi.AAC.4
MPQATRKDAGGVGVARRIMQEVENHRKSSPSSSPASFSRPASLPLSLLSRSPLLSPSSHSPSHLTLQVTGVPTKDYRLPTEWVQPGTVRIERRKKERKEGGEEKERKAGEKSKRGEGREVKEEERRGEG